MPPGSPEARWRRGLLLLSAAAGIRAFSVGLTGVLLGLYLARRGYSAGQLGLIVGCGLAGNAAATAWLAWAAPQANRRAVLVASTVLSGAGLIGVANVAAPLALGVVVFLGLVNGMGRDRGPAQVVEQSLLSDRLPPEDAARVMVRYSATQDVCASLGSLAAALPDLLPGDPAETSRALFVVAGLCSLLPLAIYAWLVPADPGHHRHAIDHPLLAATTRRRIRGLTGLFALDSLGGGFLAGSILSYWFFKRFGLSGEVIGPLFLVARGLNAGSYFAAEALARRLGLVKTMVYTHLPSSAFLLALPWAPSPAAAIVLFLAREALVQMDVPARQAFVAQVTRPGERVHAFGVTGLARNVGWAAGPGLAGWSVEAWGLGAPLVIGAGLKMVYDLLLYRSFAQLPAAHHEASGAGDGPCPTP